MSPPVNRSLLEAEKDTEAGIFLTNYVIRIRPRRKPFLVHPVIFEYGEALKQNIVFCISSNFLFCKVANHYNYVGLFDKFSN